jgi:hypothetical protein
MLLQVHFVVVIVIYFVLSVYLFFRSGIHVNQRLLSAWIHVVHALGHATAEAHRTGQPILYDRH